MLIASVNQLSCNMLGLPGGFARNFNMWGGVGWGGVGWGGVGWGGVCQRWCSCVHMVRCWCVDVYTWYVGWGGVGWGGVGWGGVCQRWCSCVHMVRCWCVDVYTWYVGWGGVCQRWRSCVHMVRCWCVDVYTWYVGWGGVGCVNVGVHVYTWYTAGVSCANVSRNRSVMFDCPSFPHLDWVQCISSYHVSPFCLTLSVYFWCM